MEGAVAKVDVRDMVCSRPILEVKNALSPLSIGDVLEIICDADMLSTIERVYVKVQKHEIIGTEEDGPHFRIHIRKLR